jgi:hypothetical protein
MATNYYQDPFGAPDYSAEGMPSLFSLSNLESLGRGSVAGLLDLPYFFEGMLMGDVDPRMPQRRRVVPSSEQVLATTPRMTQPTPQAGLLETAGAFMSPAPVAAVKPVAQAVGKGGKAVARMAGEEINAAMMGERGGLLGAMTPQPMNIVPPSVVRQIDMPVNLPKSKEFFNAVTQEPSAAITPEGLLMNVKRQQVPDQSGMESVRTGVFYLPESQSASVYKGKQGYGGSEPIQGSTLYKNPLFVKGATGGKAPESAYDQLLGKGSYQAMRNEALDVASGYRTPDFERVKKARAFLEKYGGDPDLAEYIVENSKYGNQLTYALQENAVANAVRNAGHDAVLGYSKGRGDKGEFFSEVFDVREQNYPTPQGDYQLMPQFESLLK